MTRSRGEIGECLSACIGLLLMSVVLITFLDSTRLINQKEDIDQIARKYILRMETKGSLEEADRAELLAELDSVGAQDVSLEGTSLRRVAYGETIVLRIRGKLHDTYEFEENRVSTAKY